LLVNQEKQMKDVTSFLTYQIGRACQCMRFPASGLSVTEACGGESVDGHVDQPLDSGMIQNVGL
jgi:hypothetical protein